MPLLFDRVRLRTLRDLCPLVMVIALVQGVQACRPGAGGIASSEPSAGETGAAAVAGEHRGRAAGAPAMDGTMDDHGRRYLELVAALSLRDPVSVDARLERPSAPVTIGLILAGARELRRHLESEHRGVAPVAETAPGAPDTARVDALLENLVALEARAEQLTGARMGFAEEVSRLTGAPGESEVTREFTLTAPAVITTLQQVVPGRGPLAARLSALNERFVVPPDRLPSVMARALTLCRDATLAHVALPADERIDVHYVPGAPWSGFSRYQGAHVSTMTINTELPLPVDRVLDLACHEGYPGHHVINTLRDEALVERQGWIESRGVLTFSPSSYTLEGLAAAAPRLVFSDAERLRIINDELVPLAGLPRNGVEAHVTANRLLTGLDLVTAAITHDYLAGTVDRTRTIARLRSHAIMEHPEATLGFIDEYRAYATAYTAGRVRASGLIGPPAPVDEQWRRYVTMVLTGRLAVDSTMTSGAAPAVRSTTN